jgi:hypothetical protein
VLQKALRILLSRRKEVVGDRAPQCPQAVNGDGLEAMAAQALNPLPKHLCDLTIHTGMKGLHIRVFIVEAKQRHDRGMRPEAIDQSQRLSRRNQRQDVKAWIGLVNALLGLPLKLEQIAMLRRTQGKAT